MRGIPGVFLALLLTASAVRAAECPKEAVTPNLPTGVPGCALKAPEQIDTSLPGGQECPGSSKPERLVDGTPDCKLFRGGREQILLPLGTHCPAGSVTGGVAYGFAICTMTDVAKLAITPNLCKEGEVPIIGLQGVMNCEKDRRISSKEFFKSFNECPVGTREGADDSGAPACFRR